ncbi:MAG: hypothetical protein FJ087_09850 [Deltaproteobacteria bacterium]|nr:hypothetical protein [Deltaproteobacteria bacterium]
MMVTTGANGNVFGYNYSRDPYRSETINDFSGDISVHGHWPFANLFEGNVVANVMAHGNNVKGTIRPSGTGTLADVSYCRPAGADFCWWSPPELRVLVVPWGAAHPIVPRRRPFMRVALRPGGGATPSGRSRRAGCDSVTRVRHGATRPGATRPGATRPGATRPGATRPGVTPAARGAILRPDLSTWRPRP